MQRTLKKKARKMAICKNRLHKLTKDINNETRKLETAHAMYSRELLMTHHHEIVVDHVLPKKFKCDFNTSGDYIRMVNALADEDTLNDFLLHKFAEKIIDSGENDWYNMSYEDDYANDIRHYYFEMQYIPQKKEGLS